MLRWLRPGLGVKRWAGLIGLSALVLGVGLVLLVRAAFFSSTGLAWAWIGVVAVGFLGLIAGIFGIIYSIASRTNRGHQSLYQTLKRQSDLSNGPSIVAIGGGTGLSTILRGFKDLTNNLTAIVAVTDDGGSSGRLKQAYDVPAPGDLRNCLVALAPEEERLAELVSYRFENGESLEGHSLGNLLLTALTDLNGGFPEAIRECSDVLAVEGRVLPSMLGAPELKARLRNGDEVVGETTIADSPSKPVELDVQPSASSNPEAIASVREADLIVVGPGSLYTSILTNFLEPRLCRSICESDASLIYIANLMTEPGETEDYSVADHLEKFREVPPQPVEFDHVFLNTRQAPRELREEYEREGARQVVFDYDRVSQFDAEIHTGDFMSVGDHIRHDIEAVKREVELVLRTEEFFHD
ncbi:MAG: uridine diphosphate-N-acetylglucosamine-binding protein YvcK [bacterium]